MFKFLFGLIIIVLGFLIQVILFPYLSFGSIKGDLLLVLVVYFSLKHGWKLGFILGLFAGFLQDSFSLGKLGIITLSMAGIFSGSFNRALFTDTFFAKSIIFLLISVIYFFFSFLILKILAYTYPGFLVENFVPYILYNFLLALISFFFLEKIYG
jgi:rod shape-determining protein MreD